MNLINKVLKQQTQKINREVNKLADKATQTFRMYERLNFAEQYQYKVKYASTKEQLD